MLELFPIKPRILKLLKKYHLQNKFEKQIKLLLNNPKHPGLHLELLEPKKYGVYSFRIDRKFRALFFFRPDHKIIEILNLTVHYQ